MYITLEISRPIQWKPKVLRFPNVRVMIVEWLYFAIHINPTYTPAQIIKATGLAAQREALARAEAAEKRVAEVEEQREWHITEPPAVPDWYIVEKEYEEEYMNPGVIATTVGVALYDGDQWIDIKTELPLDGTVIGWRPIV